MKTRVFLTVDVEFSIAGAFAHPRSRTPIGVESVLGVANGRSEGLQFVLDTLGSRGLRATFFVEALQALYFGDEPMQGICSRLRAGDHDVQLHLHPVWEFIAQADWQHRLASEEPNDDLDGRQVKQVADWLQSGIDTFARWRLPAPVAFRAGSNRVDRNVYRAMAAVGMKLASNVARGIFDPAEHALRLSGGVHRIEGVVEVPVTSFFSGRSWPMSRCKSLTITGTSERELISIFDTAHAQGQHVLTLLTHCHEFFKGDARNGVQINRINQARFTALCDYLCAGSDRFEIVVMRDLVQGADALPVIAGPDIRLPLGMAFHRMWQNKLNDFGLA